MMLLLVRAAKLAIESEVQQPEHVKRGKHRGEHTDSIHSRACGKSMRQYLVLREETGKRRNTRNSQCTDQHRDKSNSEFAFQAAHIAHILFAAARVDNGTG